MNIEVEIKIQIDNFNEIKSRVEAVGKLIKSIKQIDDYYIPFHENFFEKKPFPVEWLRIRTNPDKVVFEYTRAVGIKDDGNYEFAEEYETEISSPEELRKILNFLDFKKYVTVNKQREYWDCGDIEIALDKIEGLGSFIEAEAKGDFESVEQARQACLKFLEDLGIKNAGDVEIKKGYPVLLLEKSNK